MLKGKKGRAYPFTLKVTKTVRPEKVDQDKYGPFMRVVSGDYAIWGFENELGMGLFYIDYKNEVIENASA